MADSGRVIRLDVSETAASAAQADVPIAQDILCISSIDWDFIWQGHQEIMSTLAAQGHRVLFVENTGVRPPKIRDLPRLRRRLQNWSKGRTTPAEPVTARGGGHGA